MPPLAVNIHQYRFYEKVAKVKDDVAAIPNFFPRAIVSALGRAADRRTAATAQGGLRTRWAGARFCGHRSSAHKTPHVPEELKAEAQPS
jgi:hypothetical protein